MKVKCWLMALATVLTMFCATGRLDASKVELLAKAHNVRIINNTMIPKSYILRHTKEPEVWVNIIYLKPMEIFHTRLVAGRYYYELYDVSDDGEYIRSNGKTGYFSIDERQLKKGYLIELELYPFDNKGKDWTGEW